MTNRDLLNMLLAAHREMALLQADRDRLALWVGGADACPVASVSGIAAFVNACRHGQKIEAIKELRSLTGISLRESKDAVEGPFLHLFPTRSEAP